MKSLEKYRKGTFHLYRSDEIGTPIENNFFGISDEILTFLTFYDPKITIFLRSSIPVCLSVYRLGICWSFGIVGELVTYDHFIMCTLLICATPAVLR